MHLLKERDTLLVPMEIFHVKHEKIGEGLDWLCLIYDIDPNCPPTPKDVNVTIARCEAKFYSPADVKDLITILKSNLNAFVIFDEKTDADWIPTDVNNTKPLIDTVIEENKALLARLSSKELKDE